MPYDPRNYRRLRQRSIAGPIVLIGIGAVWLLGSWHVIGAREILWTLGTWWPALLIVLGVVRIVEYAIARNEGGLPPRLGGGAVALVVLFIICGLSLSSARH